MDVLGKDMYDIFMIFFRFMILEFFYIGVIGWKFYWEKSIEGVFFFFELEGKVIKDEEKGLEGRREEKCMGVRMGVYVFKERR